MGVVLKFRQIASSIRKDGWFNTLTGLGLKSKDKRLGANITWEVPVETTLEHLYACDDVAQTVVDRIPGDAFREGFSLTAEGESSKEQTKEINDYFDMLKVTETIIHAWQWARLYGGSGIFISANDGLDLREPLNLQNIKDITALNVLSRFELHSHNVDSRLSKDTFFTPTHYQAISRLGSETGIVHASRIIRFDGAPLPRTLFIQNNYWSDSVLTKMWNVLRNFNLAHDSAASLIQDFSIGVLKLKNLADLVQEEDSKTLFEKRLEMMNLSKSILNTVVLDAEDEGYEHIARTVTGLHELLEKVNNRLVTATGMPATIILGKSPTGGLSGKGESEARDYYDLVDQQRKQFISPLMTKLFKILLLNKKGPTAGKIPKGFDWSFNSLWQLDEKEQAEVRKTVAEADNIYLQTGVLDPTEVAKSRFGGDEFSIETEIDLKSRESFEPPQNQDPIEE